jgi:3-hydroxybutyryl-CoA dehydratase
MTESSSKKIYTFEDLTVGQSIEKDVAWTSVHRDLFSQLTGDAAPVHMKTDFALKMGFPQPILFGLLLISGFSEMVGGSLPGPQSVIHSVNFDFVQPAFVGELLTYKVEIIRLSPSVKTIILKATISRNNGELLVQGKIQCGLKG